MAASVCINASVYQKLQQIADGRNCPLQQCLEEAVLEYIDNYEAACRSADEGLDGMEHAFFMSVAE